MVGAISDFQHLPSGSIELEDHEIKKFVVNGQWVKQYNVKGPMVAKAEFVHFKDSTW